MPLACSIHDLSDGPLAAADVLPYEATPEEMTKLVEPRLTSYVSQAHHAKASIVTHVSVSLSLSSIHPSFFPAFNCKHPLTRTSQVASLMGSDTRGPVSTRPRCLGPALQLALVLASLTRKALGGVGHVVCVLGGPGTVGPGQAPAEGTDSALGGLLGGDVEAGYLFREATGFYAELVERAQRDGTGIDFLGGGSRAVNVALLAPVAQLTGGAIVLHEDIAEGLGATAKGALTRHVGHQGFVEVRAGPRLGVSRVVGPSLPLEEAVRRRHGLSRAASAMASAEESHGWGVFVEPAVSALPLGETLAVQAVASWLLPGGWRVWRVATVLLEVAPDASDALASVDAAVCAVLMGKMAAAEAIRAGWPHEEGLLAARRFADSTVKRLRGSFGSPTVRAATAVATTTAPLFSRPPLSRAALPPLSRVAVHRA